MNSSIQQAFLTIQEQSKGAPDDQVYVIELESIPLKKISPELGSKLEKFTSLQYLAFNNCELESLDNFPELKGLIRLDLISNKLDGDQLEHILGSRYLQTLYLSANQFSSVSELKPLQKLTNLLQLDLVANDLTKDQNYIKKVFDLLPSLKIVDSTNLDGTTNDVISESLKRIRPDLFVRGKSKDHLGNSGFPGSNASVAGNQPLFKQPSKKVPKNKQSQVPKPSSLKPQPKAVPLIKKRKPKKTVKSDPVGKIKSAGKAGKSVSLATKRQSLSSKAGLVFKASRIGRRLRASKMFGRVSSAGTIYLTAVLEYVCAEVLEVAKDLAVKDQKKRINPKHIKIGVSNDEDLKLMFKDIIIPEAGNEQLIN